MRSEGWYSVAAQLCALLLVLGKLWLKLLWTASGHRIPGNICSAAGPVNRVGRWSAI